MIQWFWERKLGCCHDADYVRVSNCYFSSNSYLIYVALARRAENPSHTRLCALMHSDKHEYYLLGNVVLSYYWHWSDSMFFLVFEWLCVLSISFNYRLELEGPSQEWNLILLIQVSCTHHQLLELLPCKILMATQSGSWPIPMTGSKMQSTSFRVFFY